MQKKILKNNLIYFIIFFFLTSCSSVPKYPQNACKIFDQKYLWYKSAKKSSDTYGAPIHIILAFVKKESGFNRWAKPKRKKLFKIFLTKDLQVHLDILKLLIKHGNYIKPKLIILWLYEHVLKTQ